MQAGHVCGPECSEKIKMTRREYAKLHPDLKATPDGGFAPAVMKWVNGHGTCLVPVEYTDQEMEARNMTREQRAYATAKAAAEEAQQAVAQECSEIENRLDREEATVEEVVDARMAAEARHGYNEKHAALREAEKALASRMLEWARHHNAPDIATLQDARLSNIFRPRLCEIAMQTNLAR